LTPLDANKLAEIRTAEQSLADVERGHVTKPFGIEWDSSWWGKWTTIHHAFHSLGIPPGARVLDLGSGTGWSTLLLAEAGYHPLGVDPAPGNTEISRRHAARWNSRAEFETGDMERLDVDPGPFDAALVFDALHHLNDPQPAVDAIASRLAPGGWVLFGEPSMLHFISPNAWKVHRETGWTEKGITVRVLKRRCRQAGLGEFRRFFEGAWPYENRVKGYVWELVRLTAANVAFAPSYSIWLAARKPARASPG
jgi:SAM-dependent methyltransferase